MVTQPRTHTHTRALVLRAHSIKAVQSFCACHAKPHSQHNNAIVKRGFLFHLSLLRNHRSGSTNAGNPTPEPSRGGGGGGGDALTYAMPLDAVAAAAAANNQR